MPGPATETLSAAARQAKAYLAVGVVERDTQFSRGTLYCTTLYFGPDGCLLGKHRKLKPTGAERLIWGEGDGHAAGQGGGTHLLGEYVAGPLFDEEGMLMADLDVGEIARAKFDFDVVGHYGCPDVFQLTINERPAPPVTMSRK